MGQIFQKLVTKNAIKPKIENPLEILSWKPWPPGPLPPGILAKIVSTPGFSTVYIYV